MNPPLPQDLELERQLLGAMMVRPDLIIQIASILRKEDFYNEAYRLLYDTIHEMSVEGKPVDTLLVIQTVKEKRHLNRIGDPSLIMELAENVVSPATAPLIARKLKNLSVRRQLILTMNQLQEEAGKAHEDENQFLKNVSDQILRITNETAADGPVPVKELRNEFLDYIQHLFQTKGGVSGLRTGYELFDSITSGLKGGELVILAARPGQGKTTFAMNMAANVSVRGGAHALVFSLEMGKMEIPLRMVSAESQVNLEDLKKGNIPHHREQAILNAIDRITSSHLILEDSGTVDIWDIITLTRKVAVDLEQRGEKLSLVVVDYLQLISDPDARKMGRQQEVASVSRSLKQLARMVNVPVVALSQMNRSVEQRKGDSARPQLSDLRESGAIEQDADIVLFIHRETSQEQEKEENFELRGTTEIIIAKHRNGRTDSFRLAYRPEINRFDNWAGASSDLGG